MSASSAVRLYGHAPTIAAAAAAAMATAAANTDRTDRTDRLDRTDFLSKGSSQKTQSIVKYSAISPNPNSFISESIPNKTAPLPPPLPLPLLPVSSQMALTFPSSLLKNQIGPLVVLSQRCFTSTLNGSNRALSFSPYSHFSPLSFSLLMKSDLPGSLPSTSPIILASQNPNFPTSNFSSSNPFINPKAPFSALSKSLHSWHFSLPVQKSESSSYEGKSGHMSEKEREERERAERGEKPAATVVLLGWLGAKQRHMKKYAEFYNRHGLNALTFVVPMKDLIGVQRKFGEKAEEHLESLVGELERWLELESPSPSPSLSPSPSSLSLSQGGHGLDKKMEDKGAQNKVLMFHTFSNTGWLLYGAILKRLQEKHGKEVVESRIRGCVVDSAPAPQPTPQVWASGFSAAFLKKRSIAASMGEGKKTKAAMDNATGAEGGLAGDSLPPPPPELGPSTVEKALLTLLEKFFAVFLHLPEVKRKLSEVTTVLSKSQPSCPQLYIYSSSDKVIPYSEVESFIELQKKNGKVVLSHRLEESPHVDHFRTFPEIYSGQLKNFLRECLPHWNIAPELVSGEPPRKTQAV